MRSGLLKGGLLYTIIINCSKIVAFLCLGSDTEHQAGSLLMSECLRPWNADLEGQMSVKYALL